MADLLTEELTAYLRSALSLIFDFGECDCALWAANWIVQRRGIDPAAPIRGRYKTRLGCMRLATRNGGFVAFTRTLLGAAGLSETDDPKPGDVGVIETPLGPALGIKTHRGWAWKSKRGFMVVPAKHIAAWSV